MVSVGLILLLPKVAPWFFGRYGDRVIEPEIKLVFACLFVLMVLADASQGHAVLPAFILGLMMSRHYQQHRSEQERLRVVAFAFLTPFFFLRGGLNVSLPALFANIGVLGVLFAAKLIPKIGLIQPLARRYVPENATFTTLLMNGSDLRNDRFALRVERRNHRQDAVLAASHGRGSLGDRSHGDRPALVLA